MVSAADEALVRYRVDGRTALITLNRPHARNAINPALASAIEDALDRAEQDEEVWVMVITGEGEVFCAGADLKAIASGDVAGIDTERGGFAGLVRRDRAKPLIAAVNGPALAGGFEIALASDMIVAASTAQFGLPEVKRSLMAIAGGLIRLPYTVPKNVAMELALTGDAMTAERAATLGLVNVVCPREQVVGEAMKLAERIAKNAPLAVQASRRVLTESMRLDEATAWRLGDRALIALVETEDFKEGPQAFVEKRAPEWTGR